MNYFLNNYRFFVYFLSACIFLLLILSFFISITIWINNHFNLSRKWLTILTSIHVFGSILLLAYLLHNVPDYLNDGKIRYVFILSQNNKTRLVTWFTRVDTPAGVSMAYSHRLKSYDLNSGKILGREDLLRRYYTNDYRIYGPFGNKAWGYSKKSGVQLLDLFQPKVLFRNKDILDKNPQLGYKINIYEGYYYSVYEPVSHGLYVVNALGKIYRINPDITADFADDVTRGITKKNRNYSQKWLLEGTKDVEVKKIHAEGSKLSADSKTFISPEVVEYWDDESQKTGNIWIMHWSLEERKADHLVSYINKYGEELNCINLSQIFKNKKAIPYFAIMHEGNILLFVTSSHYTLSALITDINDGHVLGRINYFK